MKIRPCLLFLSCKNYQEADKISDKLLRKKLIVCVKKISVNSSYLWKNSTESAEEVLLIMDSVENLFEKINKEIKKLHSYSTYTLFMTSIKKTNNGALKWLQSNLLLPNIRE